MNLAIPHSPPPPHALTLCSNLLSSSELRASWLPTRHLVGIWWRGLPSSSPGAPATTMDPEAVRKSLEPTTTAEEITGSTPARLHFYDPFVLSGVSIEAAEHGRLLCSFVVTPRHASPAGYLRSGVTATLADQLGSAVFFCSGLPSSGVSIEISVSFVDAAAVGEEIEVEGKLLRAGKSVGVVSVDFRKKKTGKLMAQARHTKYLVASSKL